MSKKIYLEEEHIQSRFFPNSQEESFLIISDIHYHPRIDETLYKMIIPYVAKTKPDYIIMPGDIFETDEFLEHKESLSFFDTFIHHLAELSKVIIIPGNHDIIDYNTKVFMNKNYSSESHSIKYLTSLNRIPGIYFLNNEQLDINNITFLGLNPRNETYLKKEDSRTNAMFIEDFYKGNYHLRENGYTIILCHNPLPLLDPEIKEAIPEFSSSDLAIAGHFHNGYMPRWITSHLKKNSNIGIFTVPWIPPIPGTECRGLHPFGREGYLYISKAFRKVGIMKKEVFANDMEKLYIRNPKQKVLKK